MTGSVSTYGESAKNGAQLCIDEINENGGINGKKVVIKYEDDEVINQIIYSRNDKNVKGNCFFRLASLEENRLGFTDKLKSLYEKNK